MSDLVEIETADGKKILVPAEYVPGRGWASPQGIDERLQRQYAEEQRALDQKKAQHAARKMGPPQLDYYDMLPEERAATDQSNNQLQLAADQQGNVTLQQQPAQPARSFYDERGVFDLASFLKSKSTR